MTTAACDKEKEGEREREKEGEGGRERYGQRGELIKRATASLLKAPQDR